MEELASLTEFVGWDKCQVNFPFCNVTIPTPFDGVGIVVGEGLLFYARIEMEDAFRFKC